MESEFRYSNTRYGFDWGPAKVERIASTPAWGVVVEVRSGKQYVQVRVTPSGLIRVGEVERLGKK